MADSLDQLDSQIQRAMLRDRHRLRQQLRQLRSLAESQQPFDRKLERWRDQLEKSAAVLDRRQATVPSLNYDAELPITEHREEIIAAIQQHPVVIVCGDTGSGKSTQLPKLCLEAGRGIAGVIGHTQPRRIAARSVASRLASELGTKLGQQVGFKIRFTDQTQESTFVKLMTDGILLAETQSDRFLEQYDTLIIDEAHERSLNIDFLLGYIRRLQTRRRDLRCVITSATIDAEHFSKHFVHNQQPAPIIQVSGRTYPVEVRYRPLEDEAGESRDVFQAIQDAVEELSVDHPGDMLIFLPTERDIREAARVLRGHIIARGKAATEILPLYARLSTQDQDRIFKPHPKQRIVLATNVAESSLTVPGIRSVIDVGTARISRYSPRSKVQRLPIEAVSRASADQRHGRCGRVGPGVCIRLYSEDDYLSRDRFTTPEIRRTNLASVILQSKALKLGALDEFPFLDPPRPDAVRDGFRTLFELGAIDRRNELTDIGKQLTRFPVDPRIGRIILAGDQQQCLSDALIIAAALELQDPRERPVDKQQAADEKHQAFVDEDSDFISYLKLWDFFHDLKEKLSKNQLRKACQQNFLSWNRMRMVRHSPTTSQDRQRTPFNNRQANR